ncbi:MAG: hypothetical protein PHV45_04465 [Desulfuromonas thiophila]|nr:hypothetical protein [Desulfuromonas thiophila]
MVTEIANPQLQNFRTEAQQLMKQRQQPAASQPPSPVAGATPQSDRVSLGQTPPASGLYSANLQPVDEIAGDAQLNLLRQLVIQTFQEQGLATEIALGNETIDLQSLTPAQAQELVAEDGYFGVEQTSQRIVDFAIGLAGNDPSRLDAILSGVEKGFGEAEKAFGGTLPDISYATRDAVLQKLDDWAASFEPQA